MKVQSFRQLYISLLLFFSFSLVLGHSFVPHHHHKGLVGMQANNCQWEHSPKGNALSRLLYALYSVNLGANHLTDFQAYSQHYECQQVAQSLLPVENPIVLLPVLCTATAVGSLSNRLSVPSLYFACPPPLRGPPFFS